MSKHRKLVFETLRRLAVLKDSKASQERLTLMTGVLVQYEWRRVKKALEGLALESQYFPDIAEIVSRVNPKLAVDDKANEIAGHIINAAKRYGIYQSKEASEYLGAEIWGIVILTGGWSIICNSNPSTINTLRAQVRDLARARIKVEPEMKMPRKIMYGEKLKLTVNGEEIKNE